MYMNKIVALGYNLHKQKNLSSVFTAFQVWPESVSFAPLCLFFASKVGDTLIQEAALKSSNWFETRFCKSSPNKRNLIQHFLVGVYTLKVWSEKVK